MFWAAAFWYRPERWNFLVVCPVPKSTWHPTGNAGRFHNLPAPIAQSRRSAVVKSWGCRSCVPCTYMTPSPKLGSRRDAVQCFLGFVVWWHFFFRRDAQYGLLLKPPKQCSRGVGIRHLVVGQRFCCCRFLSQSFLAPRRYPRCRRIRRRRWHVWLPDGCKSSAMISVALPWMFHHTTIASSCC